MLRVKKTTTITLFIGWVLCLVAFCAIQLQMRGVFVLGWDHYPILPENITPKENLGAYAYQVHLPREVVKSLDQSSYHAVIFEDGIPLPVYYREGIGRYRVGREGAGNFLLRNRRLFFSATDNSDPRSSGKHYDVGIPRRVDQDMAPFLRAGVILFSLSLVFMVFKTGHLKTLAKAVVIVGFNVAIIIVLVVCFEHYLRRTNGNGSLIEIPTSQRLPYDSNYARNDLTYYKPEEILDESQGLFTWGIQVKKNSLGFREREFPMPKPADTYRVIVLGDSLTYGIGLHPEERYTDLTEANLKERLPQRKIEVLNFGHPGADLNDELNNLISIKNLVQPDLIVIGFCSNDLMLNVDLYQVRKKQFEIVYGPAINFFINRLRKTGLTSIATVSRRALDGLLISMGVLPNIDYSSEILLKEETPEATTFSNDLMVIKWISDEMGLPPPVFIILNQDPLTGVPTDYRDLSENLPVQLRLYHKAEMMAEAAGFDHFNYEKEILAKGPKNLVINEVDDHPSAELNLIYAKKLTSILLQIVK